MWRFSKGHDFEDEIEYVYRSILENEGVKIDKIEKRCKIEDKNGIRREFDVYYEFKVAGNVHRVAIECKNYKRPISIEIVDQFVGKLKDFNNIYGCIIAKNGYQKGAKEKAIANGIETIQYDSLPKFNQILARKIQKVWLPTNETIGSPFYTIMEKDDGCSTTGTSFMYEETILLFICRSAAMSYLKKLPPSWNLGVFGVSKEQLCALCLYQEAKKEYKLAIVPVLGLERETSFVSFEYSGEEIRKAFSV